MIDRFLVRVAAAAASLIAFSSPTVAATPERNVFYTSDSEGRQLTATYDSAAGTEKITNTYDGFGELKTSSSTSAGAALTLSYLYDADGNRIRLTFPDTNFFTYSYDGLDRETGILQAGTTNLFTMTYDQLGRRSSLARTGAGKTTYAYDNASRLQSLTDQLGTAVNAANDETLTFGYYASDQIKSKTLSNSSYVWTPASTSVNRGYAVNGLNQYTTAGAASFAYDANGNLTSDGTNSYTYDAENRLLSAAGATSATLTYDPLGRLVTTAGTATTRLVYDGDDLVAEYNSAGTLLRRYLHGPGTDDPLIQYEGATVAPTVERHLYSDAQGSIIAATDNAGNLIAGSIDKYDEYGIPQTDSSGHSLNSGRFQYTGQQWIGEVGMYYYKARFYSPTLGRFMQTDPVGYKDQDNLYEYVGDDPVDGADPSGERNFVFTAGFDMAGIGAEAKINVDYTNLEVGLEGGVRAGIGVGHSLTFGPSFSKSGAPQGNRAEASVEANVKGEVTVAVGKLGYSRSFSRSFARKSVSTYKGKETLPAGRISKEGKATFGGTEARISASGSVGADANARVNVSLQSISNAITSFAKKIVDIFQ